MVDQARVQSDVGAAQQLDHELGVGYSVIGHQARDLGEVAPERLRIQACLGPRRTRILVQRTFHDHADAAVGVVAVGLRLVKERERGPSCRDRHRQVVALLLCGEGDDVVGQIARKPTVLGIPPGGYIDSGVKKPVDRVR
ncbi:hypothetical protein AB0M95_13640 [Sphaerisporangium sp. NPDC051017]|uniref:hypothetical protein n=1 Tax=Sphaerisporangium sp. NPDC051017 TaxID=3154636 RepID=UPI003446E6C9